MVSFVFNHLFNIVYLSFEANITDNDHDQDIDMHSAVNDSLRKADSLGEDIDKLTELVNIICDLQNAMSQEPERNTQSIKELEKETLKMRTLRDTIRNNLNEMKANTVDSNAHQRILENLTKHLTERFYSEIIKYYTLADNYKNSCTIRIVNEIKLGPNLCDPVLSDGLKTIDDEIDKLFENEHPFWYPRNMPELYGLLADFAGVIDMINKQESDNSTIEDHVNNAPEYF
ncbi:unnamed protein product [Adineta steineri]|uniref:Uncharacterized protein n=1 Tax=Adineta steineri TaxID=433720 RepID=A0A818QZW2_9BILA|nr:unnamed protein product [Adineta steineri]CAF3646304.1 unnamed protein product [Adineta steineri]